MPGESHQFLPASSGSLGYHGPRALNLTCHPTTLALREAAADDHTHLAWSFADAGPNLTLNLSAGRDEEACTALNELKATRLDLRTFIAPGGCTLNDDPVKRDRWTRMAATKTTRRRCGESAVRFISKHGFDGSVLNWKLSTAEDRAGRPEDPRKFVVVPGMASYGRT
ncbi:hypothetical protein MMPV_000690 [Pyropia vietnamensis]